MVARHCSQERYKESFTQLRDDIERRTEHKKVQSILRYFALGLFEMEDDFVERKDDQAVRG